MFYSHFCQFGYSFISLCAPLQEELQGLKQRIRVVVVENEKLQSELQKSRITDESFKDYTIQNSMVKMYLCLYGTDALYL